MNTELKRFLDAMIDAGGNDPKYLNGIDAGLSIGIKIAWKFEESITKLTFESTYNVLSGAKTSSIGVIDAVMTAYKEMVGELNESSKIVMDRFRQVLGNMELDFNRSNDELQMINGEEEDVDVRNNELAL